MIRFSARGSYLLWVPQGRALIRDRAFCFRDRAVIRDRALITFLRNHQMFKTKLLKEFCTRVDITVGKLRRRPLIL